MLLNREEKVKERSLRVCLSYYSMIRHHDQGNLEKKEFIGGLQLQGARVQDHHNGSMATGRQACCWSTIWELTSRPISMR